MGPVPSRRAAWWRARTLLVLGSAMALLLAALTPALAKDGDAQLPVDHFLRTNVFTPVGGNAGGGVSNFKNRTGLICSTPTQTGTNVNTDCEGVAPHNETTIAVNPNDANNMIASANDYQLRVSPGGYVYETAYSRAHVTTNGGKTWSTYGIDYHSYASTGDPIVAFDDSGNAYLATLGFVWSQGAGNGTNPDILVAHSTNGGKTWSTPSRVASGTGSWGSVSRFSLDKENMTAWGDGNAIVTYTRFIQGQHGSYAGSPIMAVVTHDGGKTWSKPVEISGSAAFCFGGTCNLDQGSSPVVADDGSIYVSFMNWKDPLGSTGRDQYLVVKVSPDTGALVDGPYQVGTIYDGSTDYPLSGVNHDGSQTYQDSQFRSWAFGTIAADPNDAKHLALVWSDMRSSTLPAPANPYATTTNSDIVVAQSWDSGQHWYGPGGISGPGAVAAVGDQFQPWATYDTNGLLRITYFDRSYDPANHEYGYTLATETSAGSLTFTTSQLTDTLSDPTQGDRWFSGTSPNAAFPNPTSFLGDYSWVASDHSGGVVAVWTDLRNPVQFGSRSGSGEDMYFAAAP